MAGTVTLYSPYSGGAAVFPADQEAFWKALGWSPTQVANTGTGSGGGADVAATLAALQAGAPADADTFAEVASKLAGLVSSADLSNPTSSARTALSAAYAQIPTVAPVRGVRIETFLQAGETLDPTGATDMAPILSRAVANVSLAAGRVQIVLPAGTFLLNAPVNFETARPGIGVRGAGKDLTVFKLGPAATSAFSGTGSMTSSTTLAGHVFSDFTIDGNAQVGASGSDSSFKGFRMSILKDCTFERVRVTNTWASGFGVDFLRNVTFIECEAKGCGRGLWLYGVTGAGAGFGIGVGNFADENALFLACRTEAGIKEGWNFEYLTASATYNKTKMRLVGCSSKGDAVGVGDHGTGGVHMTGCTIEDFTNAGVVIAPGGQAPMAGRDGVIDATNIIRRGVATGAGYADVAGGHGIVLRGDQTAGGYRLDAQIEDCAGAGIWFEPGSSFARGGLKIGATVRRCATGVSIHGSSKLDTGVRFDGGEYEDNGVALDLASSFRGLAITRNTFISNTGAQATAIRFDPTFTLDALTVRGNTAIDTATFLAGNTAATGTSVVVENAQVTSGADPNLIFFDTLIQATTTTGLGTGWSPISFSTNFPSTTAWQRTTSGATPDTSTPSTNMTGQYRSAGRVDARVSAIYNATTGTPGTRGIAHSITPATGTCVMLTVDSASGFFQVSTFSQVLYTSAITPTSNHEMALEHDAGTTHYGAYIDGNLIWEGDVTGVPESVNVGVVGAKRYVGTLMNFAVRINVA